VRRIARNFGMEALGGHIVSMTHQANDLFTVLWLWKWSAHTDGGHRDDSQLHLPIIPLFETIDDLSHAADILEAAFQTPAYRDAVRNWGDRQTVMIGYSDSTKDGGYLAACWGLQRAQIELHDVAARHGIKLTFFHGRGGSLGRGGGPAARAILSLPSRAFDGTLRLTEQGEILAERYDDPEIAHRHLEQVLWSVLVASTQSPAAIPEAWRTMLDGLAADSFRAYRRLVDHPAFGKVFRHATPIADIEGLHIASRPSRRVESDRIEDLRAIPWVFAWTQCRCLLPAWYGLGTTFEPHLAKSAIATEEFRRMYREWPFLRATIDNAVLAVAKSNLPVFRQYAALAGDDSGVADVLTMIEDEWRRTERVLLAVTNCTELLDDVPWLKESIAVRNGYVDPLNLIQVELLRRGREQTGETGGAANENLTHVKQLVVKGIAAGMRTTG
jgi:phosphoenolpyruvate carboxylase